MNETLALRPERAPARTRLLLFLALPGALPWLTIAAGRYTDWLPVGHGGFGVLPLIWIACFLAAGAAVVAWMVRGPRILRAGIVLFNLSYVLAMLLRFAA
jgi:hypothetical protein